MEILYILNIYTYLEYFGKLLLKLINQYCVDMSIMLVKQNLGFCQK